MEKLKPCPFCGGEAVFTRTHRVWEIFWRVICANNPKCSAGIEVYEASKEKAAARWNRRYIAELSKTKRGEGGYGSTGK